MCSIMVTIDSRATTRLSHQLYVSHQRGYVFYTFLSLHTIPSLYSCHRFTQLSSQLRRLDNFTAHQTKTGIPWQRYTIPILVSTLVWRLDITIIQKSKLLGTEISQLNEDSWRAPQQHIMLCTHYRPRVQKIIEGQFLNWSQIKLTIWIYWHTNV